MLFWCTLLYCHFCVMRTWSSPHCATITQHHLPEPVCPFYCVDSGSSFSRPLSEFRLILISFPSAHHHRHNVASVPWLCPWAVAGLVIADASDCEYLDYRFVTSLQLHEWQIITDRRERNRRVLRYWQLSCGHAGTAIESLVPFLVNTYIISIRRPSVLPDSLLPLSYCTNQKEKKTAIEKEDVQTGPFIQSLPFAYNGSKNDSNRNNNSNNRAIFRLFLTARLSPRSLFRTQSRHCLMARLCENNDMLNWMNYVVDTYASIYLSPLYMLMLVSIYDTYICSL